MSDLRFAELIRTTERTNPGSVAGQRLTLEADPADGAAAVGALSRPDARPQFAWLVGTSPAFQLDVLQPANRVLALNLATATDAVQEVTVLLNGHELGSRKLRRDKQPMTVRVPAPASTQISGRNRVRLDFTHVQDQVVEGEEVALPIAAQLRSVRFLPPEEERAVKPGSESRAKTDTRARLATAVEGERQQSELVLPGGSSFGLTFRVPTAERVLLRMQLMRLDLTMELWAVADEAPPELLLRAAPDVSGTGTLSVDLTPWAGRALRLNGLVDDDHSDDGVGGVALRGLAVLVPEDSEWVRDEASDEAERPFRGQLDVLRDGALPRLSWTEDGLCLEVDLASRHRRLFDLETDPDRARDLSYARPATASWLYQELTRAVIEHESREAEGSQGDWSTALRWASIRQ